VKTITANRLRDGRVVYLTAAGEWSERLEDAWRLDPEPAEHALAEARRRTAEIAAAYLIDVDQAEPIGREALRESIRRKGPTVRADLNRSPD
jgi:hypothetical protein